MIDRSIDNLVKRLGDSLPSGLRHLHQDMEKNFRAILQSSFAKMDLVTREEFDIQRAVLTRTREKLEALEKQVAKLEERLRP
ncbi:MAG: accessory factor UbiK family protein [Methylococcaceae bacterium]|nr:accessory factor UbiK family protein [Methylococcaceae bacterium]MCI0666963.1 accessory factor UbiK family protein [Methylococcaceae bacterium]MCI0732942.1 accessory factor UbiK family protein [Methylococcaceae bacterium]